MNEMLEILKRETRTAAERYIEHQTKVVPMHFRSYGAVNLTRVLGRYLMLLPTDELSVTPYLTMHGYWEMWVTQAVAQNVKEGWTCVDGGAHVGYYTMLLADLVGDNGRVISVEPQGVLQSLLCESVRLNGFLERVGFALHALSCDRQERTLHVDQVYRGGGSFNAPPHPGGVMHQAVKCIPLDELMYGTETPGPVHVDFLKLDIEGHEPEALAGAARVLREDRPTLLLEWSKVLLGKEPLRHIEPLTSAGYKLALVNTASRLAPVTTAELLALGDAETVMLWMTPRA